MRVAYLDCFSGISGDMFLGALIDAGVPAQKLADTVAALSLGAHLEVHRVVRSGISSNKVDVFVGGEKDQPREEYLHPTEPTTGSAGTPAWREREAKKHHEHLHEEHGHAHTSHSHDLPHEHAQEHSHDAGHPHTHDHGHEHHPEHAHGRSLSQIKQIIAKAPISPAAQRTATAIFQALGEAEAKIHATSIEEVHFHEVGAVDASVDIVCAAVGADLLGVDRWICSPLNVGGGTVHCEHGEFPIPAPATLELLKNAPIYSGEIKKELVTPTGAAIVRALAASFGPLPSLKTEKIGYGAGTRDFAGHPNVLRIVIGELAEAGHAPSLAHVHGTESDTVAVIEANLDDMTPEVFGYLMDRVLAEGALDVFATPVHMKKNRPGTLLTVLTRLADSERITRIIFAESSTLGVRMRQEQRSILARKSVAVMTAWGEVRIKVAALNGETANAAPEYEDCRRIARENKIPLKQVMQQAMLAFAAADPAKTEHKHSHASSSGTKTQ